MGVGQDQAGGINNEARANTALRFARLPGRRWSRFRGARHRYAEEAAKKLCLLFRSTGGKSALRLLRRSPLLRGTNIDYGGTGLFDQISKIRRQYPRRLRHGSGHKRKLAQTQGSQYR